MKPELLLGALFVGLALGARKMSRALGDIDDDEEAIWQARESYDRSKWVIRKSADDKRKGKFRLEYDETGHTASYIFDELFDCDDLNATIDDLQEASDLLADASADSDNPGKLNRTIRQVDSRISTIRRLAKLNGCEYISGYIDIDALGREL